MLLSFSLIILIGFALKGVFEKLKLPGLLGMLLAGILLGPHLLNLISSEIMDVSADLREIALIVILTRVGLSLDLKDLKRVGRPALLMCFVPATLEILAAVILAPLFFDITYVEAALMGSILAAVSPAIVVPKMLHLMESGYGRKNSIPQLILAGASVDDIYVIILFTSFLGMTRGQSFNPATVLQIPLSIISGLVIGLLIGYLLVRLFKLLHVRDTVKVLLILGLSFGIMGLDASINQIFPFSGLLAVIAISGAILKFYEPLARRLTGKFSKIWVAAELLLFVMLGAVVDIGQIRGSGLLLIVIIAAGLVLRSLGVFICVLRTKLSRNERVFCAIAYLPKATVQAAIGALPLAAGVASGSLILTAAVLAILICAPLGSIGIEMTYKRLLERHQA